MYVCVCVHTVTGTGRNLQRRTHAAWTPHSITANQAQERILYLVSNQAQERMLCLVPAVMRFPPSSPPPPRPLLLHCPSLPPRLFQDVDETRVRQPRVLAVYTCVCVCALSVCVCVCVFVCVRVLLMLLFLVLLLLLLLFAAFAGV